MSDLNRNRSRLLVGSGTAALAIGLAFAPQAASAQAIQASETFVAGSGSRLPTGTGTETITIDTQTAVIEWTPDEISGTALDFLPTNNVVTYQNGANVADFAVLNMILPSTNGDIVVMDGRVISQLIDPLTGAQSRGGTVAFYSPTGIFVGGNAVFDVGNLILTTLEPNQASFADFAVNGGTLALGNTDAGPATVTIQPGAQINATAENSYFVVASAEIQMFGTTQINGSQAYIGGELVNLTVSNGLFDIQIPVGSSRTTPIVMDGNIGGPSSTGAIDDNHMIYAVAAAQNDPISMIFQGNLGFAPAASAGVVNGEIILSANYNVSGRTVDNGTISDGVNAVFNGNSELTDLAGTIFLQDFASTSSLLAIANEQVQVGSALANSSVDGNLLVVGRNTASLVSVGGFDFTINGDVLVSARDFGENGSSFQDPSVIDAQGGDALIGSFDGTMTINGEVFVTADAVAGVEDVSLVSGTATGGIATLVAGGGTLTINGDSFVTAEASQQRFGDLLSGGDVTGGTAEVFAEEGGVLTLGNLLVSAGVSSASMETGNASTGVNVFGGLASLQAGTGGSITVNGVAELYSFAIAGASNNANGGAIADSGQAIVVIQDNETITIQDDLILEATANGGNNFGGRGGDALGGRASAFLPNGGALSVGGDVFISTTGFGGQGIGGGNGFGGIGGIQVIAGTVDIAGLYDANSTGFGGNATISSGGDGGNGEGGNAFLQADGTANVAATISVGGQAGLFSDGFGGLGGNGNGDNVLAGRGGDGIGGQSPTNQADPNFPSGVFMLSDRDNATYTIGGAVTATANGTGGRGGDGGPDQNGGDGGSGIGGVIQVGQATLSGTATIGDGAGVADFGNVTITTNGTGGNGGNGNGIGAIRGNGGLGNGGASFFTTREGDVTAGDVFLNADGSGGEGHVGGDATGGTASITGGSGGTLGMNSAVAIASAFGGSGDNGGGNALGGQSSLGFVDGLTMTIAGVTRLNAEAVGGSTVLGVGGQADGGIASISITDDLSALSIGGDLFLDADAFAGDGNSALEGAAASGGDASVTVSSLGTIDVTGDLSLRAVASAGPNGGDGDGGAAVGGVSSLLVDNGGAVNIGGTAIFNVTGFGAVGGNGGTGLGGTAEVSVTEGEIGIDGDVSLTASGLGGNGAGSLSTNGDGGEGTGGLSAVQAIGSANATGTITIGGNASLFADGTGGRGRNGSGPSILAGNGGDGLGGDGAGNSAGAIINAGSDNGVLSITGATVVSSRGFGGDGGDGDLDQNGGNGGLGLGGRTRAGIRSFLGPAPTIGNGQATFGTLTLLSEGFGGDGGLGGSTVDLSGLGGEGRGARALIGSQGGTLIASDVIISASGTGGNGDVGGNGIAGDRSGISTSDGADVTLANFSAFAVGFGGIGETGPGGEGSGGQAFMGYQGGTTRVTGDVRVDASGVGGESIFGDGGDGFGGIADIAIFTAIIGSGTIDGTANIFANGLGGDAGTGGTGGNGEGGLAFVQALVGGSVDIGALQLLAAGLGGSGVSATGGEGIGGIAQITADGNGSTVTVDRNLAIADAFAGNNDFVSIGAGGFGGDTTGGTGIGGAGFGGSIILDATADGSIDLPADPLGDPASTDETRLFARGVGGGSSVDGGTGGAGFGGDITFNADVSAIDAGIVAILASGIGGSSLDTGLDIAGGAATGGSRTFTITGGGDIQGEFSALGGSGAFGGDGSGTGDGGDATAGSETVTITDSTLTTFGNSLFTTSSSGGDGGINGNGGDVTPGSIAWTLDNAVIDILTDANGEAALQIGEQVTGGIGVASGGNAESSAVTMLIDNSTISSLAFTTSSPGALGSLTVFSDATGGNAVGDGGAAGSGDSGGVAIDATGLSLDLIGTSVFRALATGGNGGATGGSGDSGGVSLDFVSSSVSIMAGPAGNAGIVLDATSVGGTAVDTGGSASSNQAFLAMFDTAWNGGDINLLANAVGGDASGQDATGGTALGGLAYLIVSDNSALDSGAIGLFGEAAGGQAASGTGGNAVGGEANLEVTSAVINALGTIDISAAATGGSGSAGGNATGGDAIFNLFDADLTLSSGSSTGSAITARSTAIAGQGGAGGDATGGDALLLLLDSNVTTQNFFVETNAIAVSGASTDPGGVATGGSIEAVIEGVSLIEVGEVFNSSAEALSADGGTSIGGTVDVDLDVTGTDNGIFADQMGVFANASGGDTVTAGRFFVNIDGGIINVRNFDAAARGLEPDPSGILPEINANGGSLLVSGFMSVETVDSVNIRAVQGNIIGGPSIADPSADIFVDSGGTINIFGDDDNAINFGGNSLTLISQDIAIADGARIGANTVVLISTDSEAPAFLGDGGGSVSFAGDTGYVLDQAEIQRIEAGSARFSQPVVSGNDPNDPDIVIGNVTASGSFDDGPSLIEIDVEGEGGIIRVEGDFAYVDAGLDDSLSLFADNRIEIVTPGSIRITDTDGLLSGNLMLDSNNVWAADADLIALLQDDPAFSGRNDQLRLAASGSDDPLGYLRANSISVEFNSTFFVRNTGTSTEQGGLLVGDGGLSLFAEEGFTSSEGPSVDAFAYGARVDAQGNLVTGEDFFREVNFNNDGTSISTFYTAASEFNDCLVNTGECPVTGPGPDPEPEPPTGEEGENPVPAINNPAVIEAPITSVDPVPTPESESDSEFGLDFPGFVDAPDDEEESDVDDPVSSGGDSSLYGRGNIGSVEVEGN